MNRRTLLSVHLIGWAGFLVLAVLTVVPARAAGPDTDAVIKYYRKKANVNTNLKVTATNMKDSAIKGAKQGTLEIGDTPNVRKVSFILSADGKHAVFGDVEDLSVNPFKKVMEKIDLKGEHFKGKADAKVTIVEYSDFQCPFCSRGYATIENQVLKEYGDKVRFVYKHFPLAFHPWAEPGAVAAECAGEQNADGFWKIYSFLFEKQKEITADNLKAKVGEALAGAKIDKAKFDDCLDNKKTLPRVKAEMAEGQSVGITGTPAFIINGRLISGAQPFEAFKNIIDDELASN